MNWIIHAYQWCFNNGVQGNVVASIIWTTPSFVVGFIIGHRKMIKHTQRHHDELMEHIHAIHKKLDKVPKKRGRPNG